MRRILDLVKSTAAVVALFVAAAVISPAQTLTTLHSFCSPPACADGQSPLAGLIQASDGNLYGTATEGGDGFDGAGSIFKITLSGALTTLYSFCPGTPPVPPWEACSDGEYPFGLVQAGNGNLYGTTESGGTSRPASGTVFQIAPSGTFNTLYSFCPQIPCPDGRNPYAALIQASDGNLYGTTTNSGRPAMGPSLGSRPAER